MTNNMFQKIGMMFIAELIRVVVPIVVRVVLDNGLICIFVTFVVITDVDVVIIRNC